MWFVETWSRLIRQQAELIQKEYPQEWLLILEILEIAEGEELKRSLSNSLNEVIIKSPKLKTLISEGMKMLELKKNWI